MKRRITSVLVMLLLISACKDVDIISSSINSILSSNSTISNSSTESTSNPTSNNGTTTLPGTSANAGSSNNSSWTPLPEPGDTYVGNYYNSINSSTTGDSLKAALSTLTSANFTNHSYESLADIYKTSDISNGKMVMFYTGTERTFSAGSLPGKTNKEHVWPQSWYGAGSSVHSAGSPGADAHNVWPCDSQLNNVRSSYAFDVLPQTSGTRVYEGGSSGTYGEGGGGTLNYGNPSDPDSYNYTDKSAVFYPRKEYRGIVARILMYVATRYYNDSRYPVQLVDEAKTSAVTGSYGRIGKLSTLLKWHLEEPVSEFEITRNNVIYSDWHNNRNPFVDKPSYACKIWGGYNVATAAICGAK